VLEEGSSHWSTTSVERDALFVFLNYPGLEATNWRAEQAIRPMVMAQGMGRPDSTGVLTQSSLREPSRLGHEVILFRDARCPACRNSVVFDGAFIIADHF
jgi:hypothetical protein